MTMGRVTCILGLIRTLSRLVHILRSLKSCSHHLRWQTVMLLPLPLPLNWMTCYLGDNVVFSNEWIPSPKSGYRVYYQTGPARIKRDNGEYRPDLEMGSNLGGFLFSIGHSITVRCKWYLLYIIIPMLLLCHYRHPTITEARTFPN